VKRLATSALLLVLGVALVTSRSAPDASSTAPAQTEAPPDEALAREGDQVAGNDPYWTEEAGGASRSNRDEVAQTEVGSERASASSPSLPAVAKRPTSGVDAAELALAAARSLRGLATWYDAGPGHYAAAGPVLRDALGDFRGQSVTVCHDGRCTAVRLTDVCACGERAGVPTLLDLSADAFRDLAPLSAGVIDVSIELGGAPTLPPTDAR